MIEGILWVLFTLLCIVTCAVILLQDAKSGGLAEAFGGAGAQTFGVKAEGIVKFTGYMAAGLVVLALIITKIRSEGTVTNLAPEGSAPAGGATTEAPAEPAAPPAPEGDGN